MTLIRLARAALVPARPLPFTASVSLTPSGRRCAATALTPAVDRVTLLPEPALDFVAMHRDGPAIGPTGTVDTIHCEWHAASRPPRTWEPE